MLFFIYDFNTGVLIPSNFGLSDSYLFPNLHVKTHCAKIANPRQMPKLCLGGFIFTPNNKNIDHFCFLFEFPQKGSSSGHEKLFVDSSWLNQ